MKKLFILAILSVFFGTNFCFAIDDGSITKKDPGLIKLPNKEEIEKKAFEAKMSKDEKEYKKKIKGLSSNLYFTYNDDNKIVNVENLDKMNLSEEDKEYRAVRNSWLEGYYMLYKTADKIIRANNLDTQNWRFAIINKTTDINATAKSANYIEINSALVDSFYDNENALAFVVGHEMAHHILNHEQKFAKISDDLAEMKKTMELSVSYPIVSVLSVPSCLTKKAVLYKKVRKMEEAADTEALTLITRAGYDVDYANDVILTFDRLGEGRKRYTDTHPHHKERLMNINKKTAMLDVEALKLEGAKNLYEKPVLTLKRSSDKKSIVLIASKNKGTVDYSPVTTQQKIIYEAYEAYLNDDMNKSLKLFEEAYRQDKKNYIPCLYLSYINEYQYKQNPNKDNLKQAKKWANKAYKKHSVDKNTIKQKTDIEKLTF